MCLLSLQTEVSHFFGYVYFRQVKDVSVKRGYFQKVRGTSGPTCSHLLIPVATDQRTDGSDRFADQSHGSDHFLDQQKKKGKKKDKTNAAVISGC